MLPIPDGLGFDAKRELLELLEEQKRREKYRSLYRYYPDTGPVRRELYPKHMEFFRAGLKHEIRACVGANRIGKTEGLNGYELCLHATGLYPSWWPGRRFTHPINGWACGTTNITVRDILQKKLLGPVGQLGTGLIPGELIVDTSSKAGVANAIETCLVKHCSGGISTITFKSYESKRVAFEGTEQDVISLDEEPPIDVYSECVIRTMATGFFKGGMIIATFTPLNGMSSTVIDFLEEGMFPAGNVTKDGRYVSNFTWEDAPHLSDEEKEKILRTTPPYLRDARSKGIPQLGEGRVYEFDENTILVNPFPIPPFWPQVYGMDVGWKITAAVWGAWDRENDVVYLTGEHYMGEEKPTVHANAIRARGKWIPGVIDPASRGRSQIDGQKLFQLYTDDPPAGEGLELYPADNALEANILEVWKRMSEGRLKIFRGLTSLMTELRMYQRKKGGKIVKENDHACDCMRYLISTGLQVARTNPSGDYDYYVERISANDDGFRRAINAIKNADDSNFGLAGTYH